MQVLKTGTFFGENRKSFQADGLSIVDSQFYNYSSCPWHYHENAHFAFTTSGRLTETHKKRKLHLSAGSLLYNHSQEPHCNSDYSEKVAALHVDISPQWFNKYGINYSVIEGLNQINDPLIKNIFFNIYKEIKYYDSISPLSVESLVVNAITIMSNTGVDQNSLMPLWTKKAKEVLYEAYAEEISLKQLASMVNIHPVYLCQKFPVYFKCSFGEYIRKIRIEKAVDMILNKKDYSLTEIAYAAGFADQSHFIRTFKKNIGITPLAFKKMIA